MEGGGKSRGGRKGYIEGGGLGVGGGGVQDVKAEKKLWSGELGRVEKSHENTEGGGEYGQILLPSAASHLLQKEGAQQKRGRKKGRGLKTKKSKKRRERC